MKKKERGVKSCNSSVNSPKTKGMSNFSYTKEKKALRQQAKYEARQLETCHSIQGKLYPISLIIGQYH